MLTTKTISSHTFARRNSWSSQQTWKNFAAFDESRHEGVFYLDKQRTSAYRIATAILDLIDQYGSPDHMNGKTENLDKWISTD